MIDTLALIGALTVVAVLITFVEWGASSLRRRRRHARRPWWRSDERPRR